MTGIRMRSREIKRTAICYPIPMREIGACGGSAAPAAGDRPSEGPPGPGEGVRDARTRSAPSARSPSIPRSRKTPRFRVPTPSLGGTL